jgi:hypothetical protein
MKLRFAFPLAIVLSLAGTAEALPNSGGGRAEAAKPADPSPGVPIRERVDLEEREFERESFEWAPTLRQATMFLGIKHAFRMTEPKTRRELGGPFLKDYFASVKGLGGWQDGDGVFTNYIAHPVQGASSGYIQIQNDPAGRETKFGRNGGYWKSRLRAAGWAAVHSMQFELGPVSEASIGNVGKKKGTMGFVDLVMTPLGGFGWMIGEDVLDRFVVERLENRTTSIPLRRFYRVVFNPTQGFANLMRRKVPWHRDTRPLLDPWFGACHLPGRGTPWPQDVNPHFHPPRGEVDELGPQGSTENATLIFTAW